VRLGYPLGIFCLLTLTYESIAKSSFHWQFHGKKGFKKTRRGLHPGGKGSLFGGQKGGFAGDEGTLVHPLEIQKDNEKERRVPKMGARVHQQKTVQAKKDRNEGKQ